MTTRNAYGEEENERGAKKKKQPKVIQAKSLDDLLASDVPVVDSVRGLLASPEGLDFLLSHVAYMALELQDKLNGLGMWGTDCKEYLAEAEGFVVGVEFLQFVVDASETGIDAAPLQDLKEISEEVCSAMEGRVGRQQAADLIGAFSRGVQRAIDTVRRLQRVLAYRAGDSEQLAKKLGKNEDRDAWGYEQVTKGASSSAIMFSLRQDHPDWDFVETEQAISNLIRRYCKRHGLERPKRM